MATIYIPIRDGYPLSFLDRLVADLQDGRWHPGLAAPLTEDTPWIHTVWASEKYL